MAGETGNKNVHGTVPLPLPAQEPITLAPARLPSALTPPVPVPFTPIPAPVAAPAGPPR
nr:hypothetical protein GCM10010200_057030 [Actinomadura rugatobispora]